MWVHIIDFISIFNLIKRKLPTRICDILNAYKNKMYDNSKKKVHKSLLL